MKNGITCKNCVYHWMDEGESFATCHFDYEGRFPGDLAPCEYDDNCNDWDD